MEFQKPITLLDAVTLLEQHNVDDGYLVGGIAEKGTQNDSEVAPVVFQDSASIIDDESVLEDTAEGLLVKNVVLYRAMVLDYGGKKIFKPPEEVKKSLITIPRMMVCDDHPPARLITNASEIKGRVLPESVTLKSGAVARGHLLVTDKVLADKIRKGKRDLSPGYIVELIDEKGEFNGEAYQAVQRNIVNDHIAVVDRGRCSRPRCGILDSEDSVIGDDTLDDEANALELNKLVSDSQGLLSNISGTAKDITSGVLVKMLEAVEGFRKGASASTDSADNSLADSKAQINGVERQLGKMQQMALSLNPTQREQVGRFVEAMNSLLLITHRIHAILSEIPKEKHDAMSQLMKQLTKSMGQMMDEADAAIIKNMSSSSENDGVKNSEDKMTESIVVDGVTHTPETIRKLLADSAALIQVQKLATETKAQLDAAIAEVTSLKKDMKTQLDAKTAEVTGLKTQIDTIEKERRDPLVKQITDAMPMLKAEDLAVWDYKRLVDIANLISQDRGDLEAVKLRMKNDSSGTKGGKSVVDDAYAKVGAEGDK